MRIQKIKSILIPKIGNKIEKKLKDLNLKPEISPKKFLKIHKTRKHRYFSPCQKGGNFFAFYARLHDNLDAKEKFLREIKFLKKIKKSQIKIKNLIPEIIDWEVEKDFEWFQREYPKAPPLGMSRNLKTKISLNIINQLTKAILEISKISPKSLKIKLKKFDFKNYFPKRLYQSLTERKIISPGLFEKISGKIKRTFPLLRKENYYFCHGDLNLGNILSDGQRIWLIDWELIHLNNFAYDIGYLWAHLWQAERSFRKKLINSYLKNLNSNQLSKFKELFPIVVSYLSLGGIEYKKEGEKREVLEKRRRFYLKILQNCIKSFKILINT